MPGRMKAGRVINANYAVEKLGDVTYKKDGSDVVAKGIEIEGFSAGISSRFCILRPAEGVKYIAVNFTDNPDHDVTEFTLTLDRHVHFKYLDAEYDRDMASDELVVTLGEAGATFLDS